MKLYKSFSGVILLSLFLLFGYSVTFAQTDGLTDAPAVTAAPTGVSADASTGSPQVTDTLTAEPQVADTNASANADAPQVMDAKAPTTSEVLRAQVLGIAAEKETISDLGEKHLIQTYEFDVKEGSIKGEKIQINIEPGSMIGKPEMKKGDIMLINFDRSPDGTKNFYILDFVRSAPIFWLFIIFVLVTVVIGRWYGLSSIIGLVISFAIIFMMIIPLIVQGMDPVGVAIMGSAIIIPATFYLSHGLNKKTSIAITGTIVSLIITGILAAIFVEITKLTGSASEEAGFVMTEISSLINMKGLLLAGIIIGSLGVLDDITISQSAIVLELKKANPKLSFWHLYTSAMRVGRDHIASMVNTLVLVYAGAAMPLLMLFVNTSAPFTEVINYEIIATEIIRTLVGSIGLILAVPVTTAIAALIVERKAKD